MPTSAVAATVTTNGLPVAFGSIFGSQFLPNVTATAQAVHRPRDIALAVDLSGSMRMGTCLGFDFYTTTRTTNNPDPLVPTFGHYSSASAALQGPTTNRTSASSSYTISPSNTTAAELVVLLDLREQLLPERRLRDAPDPRLRFVHQHRRRRDLDRPHDRDAPVAPRLLRLRAGGRRAPVQVGSTTTYATNVKDVLGSARMNILWELDGYAAYERRAGHLGARRRPHGLDPGGLQ